MEKEYIEGICPVCGQPMVWDENDPNCYLNEDLFDEEGTIVKEIKCTNCGTLVQEWINDESDEGFGIPVSNQGFGNCFNCGGTIVWGADFMRSDWDEEVQEQYNDENGEPDYSRVNPDDAIVRSCTCSGCGAGIEIHEPTPNEMKEYPYWNDYLNELNKLPE